MFAHFQQSQFLLKNKFLPEFHVYSYFHIEENFYPIHDKIRIDTDYEIVS